MNRRKNTLTEKPAENKPVASDADLLRQIEMLKAQVDTREKQLKQAIDIANRANDAQKARDEAEKAKLIDSITMDSHYTKDALQNKPLTELQIMRTTLDCSIEKTFASVAAEMDQNNRKHAPLFTAGAWDSKTQTYVGGV
jgi:LPS O-antigen subunit length determinant protein (WzzB/FepE family)